MKCAAPGAPFRRPLLGPWGALPALSKLMTSSSFSKAAISAWVGACSCRGSRYVLLQHASNHKKITLLPAHIAAVSSRAFNSVRNIACCTMQMTSARRACVSEACLKVLLQDLQRCWRHWQVKDVSCCTSLAPRLVYSHLSAFSTPARSLKSGLPSFMYTPQSAPYQYVETKDVLQQGNYPALFDVKPYFRHSV